MCSVFIGRLGFFYLAPVIMLLCILQYGAYRITGSWDIYIESSSSTVLVVVTFFNDIFVNCKPHACIKIYIVILMKFHNHIGLQHLPFSTNISETMRSNCSSFKRRLDKFWMHQDVTYDFRADLTGIGDRSVHEICEV